MCKISFKNCVCAYIRLLYKKYIYITWLKHINLYYKTNNSWWWLLCFYNQLSVMSRTVFLSSGRITFWNLINKIVLKLKHVTLMSLQRVCSNTNDAGDSENQKPYSDGNSFPNVVWVTNLFTQRLWFHVPIQTGLTSVRTQSIRDRERKGNKSKAQQNRLKHNPDSYYVLTVLKKQ